MKKNLFVVIVLSVIFATSFLYDFKLAVALLLMIAYFNIISRSLQICISIYFFLYLVLVTMADKSSFSLSGNQRINLLGILNLMLILVFYFKWMDFRQVRKEYLDKQALLPIFLFSLYLIVSIPFSTSLITSIRDLTRILSAFSFYMLAYFIVVTNKNAEEKIMKFITVLLVPLLVYGIVEYITGFNVFHNRSIAVPIYEGWQVVDSFDRIRTAFSGSTHYSFIILVFLPFYLYSYFKRKEHSNFYGMILALLIINLILTFTRISWMAVAIQIIFFLFMFRPKKILRFALPVGLFFVFVAGRVISRMTIVDSSPLGRIKLFQHGLSIFKSHPVFGSGLGTILESAGIAAHGDYMRMFAETGIFGGSGYLILLFTLLVFAVKNFKENDFAKISFITIIGFMIFSLTDNGLVYSHVFLALLGIYNGIIVREKFDGHSLRLSHNSTICISKQSKHAAML